MHLNRNIVWVKLFPFLLSAGLFFPALSYPFFSDDILHFTYALEVNPADIWMRQDVTALYYRPMVNFLLHIGTVQLNLPLHAALWHFFPIANHLVNIALVGALARELRLPNFGQFTAMMLFAVFPFAVQAVVWILAWFHVLVTTSILVYIIFGLRVIEARRSNGMTMLLMLFAGSVAPFIHENGVLAVPLLLCALIMLHRKTLLMGWRRVLLVTTLPTISVAAFWIIRSALASRSTELYLSDLDGKFAYFAQAVTFPIQFVLAQISAGDDVLKVWIGVGIFSLVTLPLVRRLDRKKAAAMILWCVIAAFPASLALLPGYLSQSERLIYLLIPAIAVLYGSILGELWQFNRAISLGFLVILIGLSVFISRLYLTPYETLTTAYNKLFDTLETYQGDNVVVVNAPLQIDRGDTVFPLAAPHGFVLHDYVDFSDFVWLNTGRRFETIESYEAATIKRPVENSTIHYYKYEIDSPTMSRLIRHRDHISAIQVTSHNQLMMQVLGERQEQGDSADFVAEFDDNVRLIAVNASIDRYNEDYVRIGLHWRKLTDAAFSNIVFVHLLCDGEIVSQSDAAPIGNLYPFNEWPVGETWIEYRYLKHAASPESCLQVRIGLYDPATGERAAVFDASGASFTEEWIALPIEFVKT